MFFFENEISSPLQRIEDTRLDARQVRLLVKRDDLLHPLVSGNKFRKLKYNLLEMKRTGKSGLITFGGAYSNHIHAVAAAGKLLGVPTVGIIRGEEQSVRSLENPEVYNSTLEFAISCGMILHFVSRKEYRDKELIWKELKQKYTDYYWLPEGGTNTLAQLGAGEIVAEITTELKGQPDYICLACGTGGTTAGIIAAANDLTDQPNIIGFSALKGDFLEKEVAQLLVLSQKEQSTVDPTGWHPVQAEDHKSGAYLHSKKHWHIQTDYHFGGYAKWTMPLIDFINDFKRQHGISLDPIYTGKLFYGIFDLIGKGYFPKNSTIVAVHTGGLQGIEGFNARFGNLLVV